MRERSERFFEETPAGQRRLILLLYALVLPPFLLVLALAGEPARRVPALAAVLALCVAGGVWVWAHHSPESSDWIFPVGFVPTVSCGIAFAAMRSGNGLGFMTILAAPLAWSAVVCDGSAVVAAWVTGTLTCFAVQTFAQGPLSGLESAAVFAAVQGLVAWVVHGKTARHRGARLRSLEKQLNDVELLVRRDGAIVDANDRAVEAYGYRREELLGMPVSRLRSPSEEQQVGRQLREVAERGGMMFETEHVRRDGSRFPVEVSTRAYQLRGKAYAHSVVRDITARHAAEEQRRFVATLFAHMQEAVVVLDEAFLVKLWSPGAERLFGWTAEEALHRSPFSFLIPEDAAAETARAITAAASGEPCARVVRRRCKDGRELTTHVSFVALQDATGAISGVMGVARDVTAQQAAEAALRESEQRLAMALLASDTEAWDWDLDRGVVHVGPRWAALLGVPGRDLQLTDRADLARFVHAEDRQAALAAALEHLEGRAEALAAEVRVPLADGSVRWANVRGRVVARGPDGAPARLLGTIRDVTARRHADEDRKRLLVEAQRATQAREQILAVVAHDLRNPLAAITSTASDLDRVLDEAGAREDLVERSEIILGAAARMGRLIEDLLDVSAIQKGGLRLSPGARDAVAVARGAVRAAEPLARRAGIALDLTVAGAPATVWCDGDRLGQVLGNLLSNALQATPAGGKVAVRVAADAASVRFSVQDTGCGFEEGQAERLFLPYQRGATASYKGAGLGLAIARGIVEGHGGRIWAERPAQGGAAFHFTIPLRAEEDPQRTGEGTGPGAGAGRSPATSPAPALGAAAPGSEPSFSEAPASSHPPAKPARRSPAVT